MEADGMLVPGSGGYRYVPRNYDHAYPHPAIVFINTDYQPPKDLFELSRFEQLADEKRAVVLMPKDLNPNEQVPRLIGDGKRVWRGRPVKLEHIERFVQNALEDVCIDRARIYVLATGDGARVGSNLLCKPWVTAGGINSWVYQVDQNFQHCGKPRSTPLMLLNPSGSAQLSITGGEDCGSASRRMPLNEMERYWVNQNGCRGQRRSSKQGLASCSNWTCDSAAFRSCTVPGGEGWAGSHMSAPLSGCSEPPAADVPAEQMFWEFFIAAPPVSAERALRHLGPQERRDRTIKRAPD